METHLAEGLKNATDIDFWRLILPCILYCTFPSWKPNCQGKILGNGNSFLI